jgi:hypothetical protein
MAMPKPDLDLDLLRCFVSVVETGSFTLAAKRLHLTQSAVTLKIQRLEEILNHELFCRKSKGFELTFDGEVTLGYAHRLLDLGQELMERIAKSTHTVRIGILHHLAFQDFPVSMAEFRRQWPSLHLTLDLGTMEELLEGIENNRFDIVVASSGYTSMADYRMSSNVSEDHLQKETLKWVQSERSQLDPPSGRCNRSTGISFSQGLTLQFVERISVFLKKKRDRGFQLPYAGDCGRYERQRFAKIRLSRLFDCARGSAERSDRPTILSPSPLRDILFQNAFDLGDGFWIRH